MATAFSCRKLVAIQVHLNNIMLIIGRQVYIVLEGQKIIKHGVYTTEVLFFVLWHLRVILAALLDLLKNSRQQRFIMNNKAISAQDLTGDSFFPPDDTVLLELEYNLPIHAGPIADISNYKGKVLSTIEEIKKARGDFSEYQSLKTYTLLFRGLKNADYQLLSSLGRKDNIDAAAEETRVINDYYNLGKEYSWEEFLPPDTDKTLFYMSIARHDGQVSRLLDWSVSFYAALSFLSNRPEVDGRLWVLCLREIL